jgi:hypothetical protein
MFSVPVDILWEWLNLTSICILNACSLVWWWLSLFCFPLIWCLTKHLPRDCLLPHLQMAAIETYSWTRCCTWQQLLVLPRQRFQGEVKNVHRCEFLFEFDALTYQGLTSFWMNVFPWILPPELECPEHHPPRPHLTEAYVLNAPISAILSQYGWSVVTMRLKSGSFPLLKRCFDRCRNKLIKNCERCAKSWSPPLMRCIGRRKD